MNPFGQLLGEPIKVPQARKMGKAPVLRVVHRSVERTLHGLTERQIRIVEMLIEGHRQAAIQAELGISRRMLDLSINQAKKTMNADTCARLAVLWDRLTRQAVLK